MSQVPPALTAVAAVARNGVIGVDGHLPWRIPEDMRHFRDVTMGGALIMGRATFDSLPRPLPGRVCVVLSRRQIGPAETTPSVVRVSSIDGALRAADATGRPAFVVGGGQVYAATWSLLTNLDITWVDADPVGDVRFPEISHNEWQETYREPHDGFTFVRYRRKDAVL